MAITDYLKGFQPETNKDGSDFEVLEGVYKTIVKYVRKEKNQQSGEYDRYRRELEVVEVLRGNGNPGRKLWTSFFIDNADSVKKLANDLFTSGIKFDTASDEAFESSLEDAVNKVVYVRAWGWTPDKKVDGTLIPEGERVARQQFVVKSESDALKDAKRAPKAKKAGNVPF